MKSLKLSLIVLLLPIGLYAQRSGHVFDVRAYGGVSFLQLASDQGTQLINGILHNRFVQGEPGVQVGAAVTFGNRFYLQPGVQWTTLSTKIINENTVSGNELTDETTLSLISVPLKVGMRLFDPQDMNWINVRLFGGLDGHHVTSVKHGTKSGSLDDINANDYSNLILNADFGFGLDIAFLYLESGYQIGLTPVHKAGDTGRLSAFYANVGLRFTFGD